MNIKKIALLALATLITAPSFADVGDSHMSHSDQLQWSGDVGLGTVDSKFHFGAGIKAQVPVTYENNDFKFGLRSGFYLGPSNPTDFIIPVLATSEYDFRVNGNLKPYLGVELGLSITHSSGHDGYGGNTNTDFAFLCVPGVNFGDGDRYFFEMPLGTLASDFAFLPSIGIHF
jgi:hypothetical protein